MKILKFGAVQCPGCLSMSKIWNDIVFNNDIEIEDYDIDFDEEKCDKYEIGDILPVYIFASKLTSSFSDNISTMFPSLSTNVFSAFLKETGFSIFFACRNKKHKRSP